MAAPLIFPVFRAYTVAGTAPLNGGKLYSYAAGTSTPLATYTDSTLGTPNANPTIMDSSGTASVWIGSPSYKFILKDSLDVTIWTADNVTESGVAGASTSEWVQFGGAPTYVSAASFTVDGDQTGTFTVGQRIKTTNTGGTSYGTVQSSVFTTLTTVTLFSDNGSLDSGLSVVYYGLLASTNRSIPYGTFTNMSASAGATATSATLNKVAINGVLQVDKLGEADAANNRIVVKQAGFYLITGIVNWTCPATAQTYETIIRLNNTTNIGLSEVGLAVSAGAQSATVTTMYSAPALSYFELFFRPSAANTTLVAGSWLGVVRVA